MKIDELKTIGDILFWYYSNLAMAHAAVVEGKEKYGRIHYMIRAKLFKGLKDGKMNVGSILDDEKYKMTLPQVCSYCGSSKNLSMDHLIPKSKGGIDSGDNVVWACKSCNSSKGAKDMLVWMNLKGNCPSLLLLRRYLKLAILHCHENDLLECSINESDNLPFSLHAIPRKLPLPSELILCIK